jgi:hypothetical protein
MMDVNIAVKNRQFIVSFRTVRLDIDKAKIIEIIISTLPYLHNKLLNNQFFNNLILRR